MAKKQKHLHLGIVGALGACVALVVLLVTLAVPAPPEPPPVPIPVAPPCNLQPFCNGTPATLWVDVPTGTMLCTPAGPAGPYSGLLYDTPAADVIVGASVGPFLHDLFLGFYGGNDTGGGQRAA